MIQLYTAVYQGYHEAEPSLLTKQPREVGFLVFSLCLWQSAQYHFSGRFFSSMQLVWNHSLSQYGFSHATISPKEEPPQQQYWVYLWSQQKSSFLLGRVDLLASILSFLRLRISSSDFYLYLLLSSVCSITLYSITSLANWSAISFFSRAYPCTYFCLPMITYNSALICTGSYATFFSRSSLIWAVNLFWRGRRVACKSSWRLSSLRMRRRQRLTSLGTVIILSMKSSRQVLLIQCSNINIITASMEEEEGRIFYDSELDFFGDRNQHSSFPTYQPAQLVSSQSIEKEPEGEKAVDYNRFKAHNPLDRLRDMPEEKQSQYFFMFNNHKRFNGIQHFFELGNQDKFSSQFLENIEMDALGNSNNDFGLRKLFVDDRKQQNYKEELQNMIVSLEKKIQEINNKMLQSVNINKTISHTFYEHFDNFSMVQNETQFFHEFENGAKNMINNCKKMKGPGVQLISSIYEFWMKSFKDFVNQIWKYSSKFTLNFFKKQEPQECSSEMADNSVEIKSESSNTINSKDKRKGWSNEQTQILEQLINSSVIFSQSVLRKLATQFNRSISSISSKIQKINKSKKGMEENSEESLLKKTLQILRMHPQGLNREAIIEKMNENYEMGYGGQWEKSVGQLLSSRKEFIKAKSKHKLLNPHDYKPIDLDSDYSKLTFKDKVIQIFLNCPNAEADLKTLVDQYSLLFEDEADSEQRKKSIEANVSKTLSRYQIFGRQAKTLYFVNPIYCKTEARNMQVEVQQFFQL